MLRPISLLERTERPDRTGTNSEYFIEMDTAEDGCGHRLAVTCGKYSVLADSVARPSILNSAWTQTLLFRQERNEWPRTASFCSAHYHAL